LKTEDEQKLCEKELYGDLQEIATDHRHASFFLRKKLKNMTNSEVQHGEELDVLNDFICAKAKNLDCKFENLRQSQNPRLDFICDIDGKESGIELTELVDGKIRKIIARSGLKGCVTPWSSQRLGTILNAIIEKKDAGIQNGLIKGAPFPEQNYLLIFTDEPELEYKNVALMLKDISIIKPLSFSLVYLVFSYNPSINNDTFTKEYIKLI
jgi:hypothetical protein